MVHRSGESEHVRPLGTARDKLWAWRYLILRRLTQSTILVLMLATSRWGWKLAGLPVLRGNLSAAELLDGIPLADPFAVLQILFTGRIPDSRVLVGAVIVLLFYAVVGGRVFCSWVCPVNPVADLAGWFRRRLEIKESLRPSRTMRYWVLGSAFLLSFLIGVAAFEWISPIGMLHREIIFGLGLGWVAVLGILAFDLLIVKHGWCGHLCPLGAFYGLLGRAAQIRVAFDASTCTHCGECVAVCHEPHVLDFGRAAEIGMIDSGDCTNCGRCVPVCPENSLAFGWRVKIKTAEGEVFNSPARRAI